MIRRKFVFAGLGGIIAAGIIFSGYQFLTDTANGTISPAPRNPTTASTASQRTNIYGSYASFSYPSKFTRLGSSKRVDPVLESYNFTKQQVGSWQVAIQISRLATGSLNDSGTYNYRQVTPGQYDSEERQIGNHKVRIFSDKTSQVFAKVAYLQQGDLAASISFMGGTTAGAEQLQADLEAMIASWRWR